MEEAMKTCTKCGEDRPLSAYTKDKSRADGLFPQCRVCRKADKHEYYLRNKKDICDKSKQWHADNPEKSKVIKKRYRDANKEIQNAKAIERKRANPEHYKDMSQRSYQKNRERYLEKHRQYRASNRQLIRQRSRTFYENNRDKVLAWQRERYAQNPERHNQLVRSWHSRNRDKRLGYLHARRARKLANGGTYTTSEWRALKAQYDHRCLCCGKQEPDIRLTIDHVIPLSKGGSNDIGNIQPLCRKCNQSKSAKAIDYRPVMEVQA